jgi:hypothetical protein
MLGVTTYVSDGRQEERNGNSPQIKSARFKNDSTSMRPLLLNSGKEKSRTGLFPSRTPHSSIYIRQLIRITGNLKVSTSIPIGGKVSHKRLELQGENSNLSRTTIPRAGRGARPSRTRISRSCRVAPTPDIRSTVNLHVLEPQEQRITRRTCRVMTIFSNSGSSIKRVIWYAVLKFLYRIQA